MSIHVHTLYYGGGITRPTDNGLVRGGFVTQDMITRSSMLQKLDFFLQASSGIWLSPLMPAILAQSGFCTWTATGNPGLLSHRMQWGTSFGPAGPQYIASSAHQPVSEVSPKAKQACYLNTCAAVSLLISPLLDMNSQLVGRAESSEQLT